MVQPMELQRVRHCSVTEEAMETQLLGHIGNFFGKQIYGLHSGILIQETCQGLETVLPLQLSLTPTFHMPPSSF